MKTSAMKIQKWGGIASFLMAVAYIVPGLIYLTGDLRHALGPLAYDLADFLYGPVWAASLVMVFFALKQRMGELAPRRMSVAFLVSVAAAGAFIAVACIRSANRQYHLSHPDLHLENSATVLIIWTTLVAGVIGTAWHFLGWAWVMVGSAGWSSRLLPRALSAVYLLGGALSLFVYRLPDLEGAVIALGIVVSIWQGILLWSSEPGGEKVLEVEPSSPD
jgi:hypothetical protein